jgi:hypothetical protein
LVAIHQQQHAANRSADEPAGLQLVQPPQVRRALDVDVLTADHAAHAGGVGELAHGREHAPRVSLLLPEHEREGLRVEAVAGQDRDALPNWRWFVGRPRRRSSSSMAGGRRG